MDEGVTDSYFLVVDTVRVDCVDEEFSEFEKFDVDDDARPDLAGHYRAFYKLVVDADSAAGHDYFRIKKCESVLVVSDVVLDIVMKGEFLGASFISASRT